ncbi:DUF1840 domain-containing protein [Glaciimonas soli]|uniref:DUF1840 family protein n=1 Tax=Glaciimonas soli TaxID=2590999 RepID=A0A843YT11_9BURK|nr:DUF1840 domain-containing protein [Glaciimonas soli]MQR00392.1 DUF1840 family protein [Glaciimonas soli]
MLITFKSKAAADVVMLQAHAEPILSLLHKEAKIGVITAAETSSVIETLEKSVAANKHTASDAIQHDVILHHGDQGDDHDHEKIEHVSFGARVTPLLEMIKAANKEKVDILWGV